MSTTFVVSVSIREAISGRELFDVPLAATITVDEHIGMMSYERTDGGGMIAVPTSVLDTVQLLVLRPTQKQMNFRLDGQADRGIRLEANGFLVVVNCTIDAGASTNVMGANSSGSTTVLEVFAGGT